MTYMVWPQCVQSAGGGSICPSSESQISCPVLHCSGPVSQMRAKRPLRSDLIFTLKIMYVTDDKHHPSTLARLTRKQPGTTKAHSDLQCEQAHCHCAQLVSVHMSLSSWLGFCGSGCKAEPAPGWNCSCSEQVFLKQTFLATNWDGYISFYPYIAHNDN